MSEEKRILIGDGFWLVRDKYCCWIEQECIHKKGKHSGETYIKNVTGYVPNVGDALISLCNRHIRDFEADSINELIEEIKSLKSLVRDLADGIKKTTQEDAK